MILSTAPEDAYHLKATLLLATNGCSDITETTAKVSSPSSLSLILGKLQDTRRNTDNEFTTFLFLPTGAIKFEAIHHWFRNPYDFNQRRSTTQQRDHFLQLKLFVYHLQQLLNSPAKLR